MDFDRRLTALRDRRLGLSRLQKSINFAEADRRSMLAERYQRRAQTKATRYVLGAMEQVDPDYTQKSVTEAERVANQIVNRLPSNLQPHWRLQGSVPLDVHIEGVSDVDFLALRGDYVTYDRTGPSGNIYGIFQGCTALDGLRILRSLCASALSAAFPAVKVDTSGSKSLSLTGGSLARKVDVVPAHWHDTAKYQAYRYETERAVAIFDSHQRVSATNLPFLHIAEVHLHNQQARGGTNKIIRLLKNIKSDSDEEITLSSYEIAGLVWHISAASLALNPWEDLALLAVAQRQLANLTSDKARAKSLRAPDGTRYLIDADEKFRGLCLLGIEVDRLVEEVSKELEPALRMYPSMLRNRAPIALQSAVVW